MYHLLTALVSVFLLLASAGEALSQTTEKAPLSPDFAHFLEQLRDGETLPGYVPPPVTIEPAPESPERLAILRSSLPARFDLRESGRVTAVRNQGSCGSCWAFAMLASLESGLLPAESRDFSENNLKNRHGFDLSPCAGGNHMMATAYLARGEGPVLESDDPYSANGTTSPQLPARKWVRNVVYLPQRSGPLNNEFLKQAVMVHGGVYTSHHMTTSASHYNASRAALNYTGASPSNHAVLIVGWDDDYPASNFPSRPAGNGAFIIKNSYGTSFGERGFMYVSYYDRTLAYDGSAYSHGNGPADGYVRIYQHDPLGWTSTYSVGGSTAHYGAIFRVEGGSAQEISAVGTYMAAVGTSYTIRIYRAPSSGPVSPAGPVAEVSGRFNEAGFFTVDLPTPVLVSPGEAFSVVVRVSADSGGNFLVPVEAAISGYSSKASATSGRSYMSSNGTSWTDLGAQGRDVCIKAFARTPGSGGDSGDDGSGGDSGGGSGGGSDDDDSGNSGGGDDNSGGDSGDGGGGDDSGDDSSGGGGGSVAPRPNADAGPDLLVHEGQQVRLNGSAWTSNSTTPSVTWTQTGGPSVSLSDYSTAQPTFTAPQVGPHGALLTFRITANSGGQNVSKTCAVRVRDTNTPVAAAGYDLFVQPGENVLLDGSRSHHPQGRAMNWRWEQMAGTPVQLTGASSATASFRAPADASTLTFRLTVREPGQTHATSDICRVFVGLEGQPPSAKAGRVKSARPGDSVTLNGSASAGRPGRPIVSYAWTQVAGTTVTLLDADTDKPYFTAHDAGGWGEALVFELTVTDSHGLSSSSQTAVNILGNLNPAAPMAKAGPDVRVDGLAHFIADASASDDDQAEPLEYEWLQISGSRADPDDPFAAKPRMDLTGAAGDQDLLFRLRVRDKAGLLGQDELRLALGEPDAPMDDGQGDPESADWQPSAGQGGAGGCAMSPTAGFGLEWLLLAAALLGRPVFALRTGHNRTHGANRTNRADRP